ncbi:MAG: hypothetical protein ACRC46_03620 [Thermoguttaceae bacterium]
MCCLSLMTAQVVHAQLDHFFYAGEAKVHNMYIVQDGKVQWHYQNLKSRGEISDAMLMSDGNVLFAHQYGITEIKADKDKEVVWSIDAPEGTEIHSVQPIGKDMVVYIQNGRPAKVVVMKISDKQIVKEFEIDSRESVHGQMRNCRLTSRGTLIVSHMDLGEVREYDSEGNTLRRVPERSVWSAKELADGNLLVTTNARMVKEYDPSGKIVWSLDLENNSQYKTRSPQMSYRLPNGNTVINNWFNEWSNTPLDRKNPPVQAIEVTKDGKVVWELCSWENPDLGPSTVIQPMNEPVDRTKLFFGNYK